MRSVFEVFERAIVAWSLPYRWAAQGLRAVFASRGLKLTAEHEARIDACADVATLARWLAQATTAKTVRAALA